MERKVRACTYVCVNVSPIPCGYGIELLASTLYTHLIFERHGLFTWRFGMFSVVYKQKKSDDLAPSVCLIGIALVCDHFNGNESFSSYALTFFLYGEQRSSLAKDELILQTTLQLFLVFLELPRQKWMTLSLRKHISCSTNWLAEYGLKQAQK